MTKLHVVTGKALIAALGEAGFKVLRTKGSHHYLRHIDGRSTVASVQAGEEIGPGLPAKILRDCELSREALGNMP
jgi:predicted RNA binding protein YcfA (HicA-like mRNA interferase family)